MDHQEPSIKDLKKPAVILDVDKLLFVDCNKEATKFFQLSRAQILTKNPFNLSPEYIYGQPARQAAEEIINKALDGENPVFDWIHVNSDGKNLHCEIRIVRIPPYDKKLIRALIIDKATGEEYRESEKYLKLTLQAAGYGIFENYPQQNASYFDDRFKTIFNFSENGQSLDEEFFSRIHPDDQDRVRKDYQRKLTDKDECTIDTEYRIIVDEKIKHIQSCGSVFRDNEGEALRMIGVVRDITSLRESQNELEIGEERLRLAVEASNIGTFDYFPMEDKVVWNQRLYQIFEIAPDSKIDLNQHFLNHIHPDDKKRVETGFANSLSLKGPEKTSTEYRIIIGKKTKHILAYSRMFRNSKGEVTRMLGTSQDVTELRQYEIELERREKLFRSIVQDQEELIVRWKPGGIRTFVNDAYCKLFHLDSEECLGKSFFPLLKEAFKKTFEEGINELTPNNPVRTYRQKVEDRNNREELFLEWKDRAYFDEDGIPIEYQSVARNITEVVEAKKELEASEERYRNVFNQQFQFTALLDLDGIILQINQLPIRLQGLSKADFIGKCFWKAPGFGGIKEYEQRVRDQLERLKKFKEPLTVEDEFKDQEGNTHYATSHYSLIKSSDGVAENILVQATDRTEMLEAKKELEASEKRYRKIFNQQFQFTALLDTEGKVVEVNDQLPKAQKSSREDYLGKYFWKSPSWFGNEAWEKKIKSQVLFAKKTGQPIMMVDPFYGVDKEIRYANSSYSVIRDNEGIVEHILFQAKDITEQKKTNKIIEERERQLSMIHENTNDYILLVAIKNGDYYFEEVNAKCIELVNDLGFDLIKEEIIGRKVKWFLKDVLKLPKERYRNRLSLYEQVRKTKEPTSYLQEVTVKGDPLISKENLIPIVDGGKLTNLLIVAHDITDSYLNRKRIESNERQLSMIYNSSNDFMLLVRVEKIGYFIESVNESTSLGLQNTGYEMEKSKLEGLNMLNYFKEILHYNDRQVQEHFENYNKVKKSKKAVRYTTEYEYAGNFFAINTTASPIIEEGKVKYILTVSRDISDIVQSKIELQEAYGELEKLKSQVEQENTYLKEEIRLANDYEHMVFKSKEFRAVLNQVEKVAKTDATVLITGETGTGKELIARAIHDNSKRKGKPMIKVNTAAIPSELIESELFGHEKGAFSGAVREKPGKFELADGGTLFLDEMGDMPADLQVKILRVLQEGEVERLGSTKTKKIDVRIIAATNKDLKKAIEEKEFREDLYFRLNVFPIEIPPLRARPDDIPILVEHFIAKYSVKHSNRVTNIPKKTMDYFRNYPWPGNVRELENTIERSVILSHESQLTFPEVSGSSVSEPWTHDNALDVVQENHIRKVLSECHWKIEGDDGAATQLKISPSTLRDRMKKFNIKRP